MSPSYSPFPTSVLIIPMPAHANQAFGGNHYPDERTYEVVQHNFAEFCDRAGELYDAVQDTDDVEAEVTAAQQFFRFVLAGRMDDGAGGIQHISFNANDGVAGLPQFNVTRDYDSMIGVSNDLPYSTHVELYPVPPFQSTLTQTNHMRGKAFVEGLWTELPMWKIPNFAFGKVQTRNVIRVFFPRMCGRETRAIPGQDLELIYDACLRPLIAQFLPNMWTHWPRDYAGAITLYRDNRGRIHQGSLDVPSEILSDFGPAYLRRLGELRPYFGDAYFVHEFRGWKGSTVHSPFNADLREEKIREITGLLVMDRINKSDWHVDVALEFGWDGHVVTWDDLGHHTLLQTCLPSVDHDGIARLLRGKAEIDRVMHLKDASGFHLTPGRKGANDKVVYVQAYSTEKTMSYQLHKGLFEPLEPKAILSKQNMDNLVQRIEKMGEVIAKCAADGEDEGRAQEGTARVEVRVELTRALTTFVTVPERILDGCLIAIPAKHWWSFKWYRLSAMHMVVKNFHVNFRKNSRMEGALALGALVIWLVNGLFRRPDPKLVKLAEEACQHVRAHAPRMHSDDDEDADDRNLDDLTPLMYDAGAYFVCDIVIDESDIYRLPIHKEISEEALMRTFGMTMDEIRRLMGAVEVHLLPRPVNVERTNNRSRQRTLQVDHFRPRDRPLPPVEEVHLRNLQFEQAPTARGPDVAHFIRNGGGNRNAERLVRTQHRDEENVTRRVKVILEQFFHDMLMESPNKRGAGEGPWTNIPKERRAQEATEQLYKSWGLPFLAAQYSFLNEQEWQAQFDRLFPTDRPEFAAQNFKKCQYFFQWLELMASLLTQSRTRVRAAVRVTFDSLVWIPFTLTDRMWSTKSMPNRRGWFSLPNQPGGQGPCVAINPHAQRNEHGNPYLRPVTPRMDLHEEEESTSEEEDRGGQFTPNDSMFQERRASGSVIRRSFPNSSTPSTQSTLPRFFSSSSSRDSLLRPIGRQSRTYDTNRQSASHKRRRTMSPARATESLPNFTRREEEEDSDDLYI